MKISRYLCLILMACSAPLFAQEADTDTTTVVTEEEYVDDEDYADEDYAEEDSTYTPVVIHNLVSPKDLPVTKENADEPMTLKKFDKAKWEKVVGKETFQEKPEKQEPKEEEEEAYNLPSLPWDSDVLQAMAYVLIIAVILAIVYMFTKDIRFTKKIKPNELPETDLTTTVENIEHIDISTPLQKALADRNFKLATRLYFLELLKKLNEGGYILWKKDKTNRDYLLELSAKAFSYDEIRKLTLTYELVWYGEHNLSDEHYQTLFTKFDSVYQKINTPATT